MSQPSTQTNLAAYASWDFDYTPERLADDYPQHARRELNAWGLDQQYLGEHGTDVLESVPDDVDFHRYQFDRVYLFPVTDQNDNSWFFPAEFRTYVNYVGEPPADLKRHIRETSNPQLVTLFNTGPYQSWLDNFNFTEHTSNVEDEDIGADEATALGVPQWEVVFQRHGNIVGEANGFFDPFELRTHTEQTTPDAPDQVVWNVSWNQSRGDYQLSPPGRSNARARTKRIRGKTVYVNGEQVGSVTTDGRVWLKKQYQTSDQTYRGNWSREKLVQETAATYAAIRDGGNLYKTRETGNAIYLTTARAKPDDYSPVDADAVNTDATEQVTTEVTLALSNATDFFIRNDTGQVLSKYSTPQTRTITEKTTTDHFGTVPEGTYTP